MNSAVSVRNRAMCWAFVTWENSFAFVRVLTGLAAYASCLYALTYCWPIEEAKEKAGKDSSISHGFAVTGTMFAILLLPLVLVGKHLMISHYIPNKPRRSAIKWRLGVRVATLLLTSLTMLGSVTVTPTEDGKTEGVKLLLFLLGSIILCEATLLDGDNCGVFELTLCVLLVQMSKAFPKLGFLYLYGIIVLCYGVKEMMMLILKQLKKQVVHRETNIKKKEVEQLRDLWNATDVQLRNEHRIDVNDTLPDFLMMKTIINNMGEKDIEEQ